MRTLNIPTNALEIYKLLPEGTRCEVLYNVLTMSPAPSILHQTIAVKLTALLFNLLNSSNEGIVLAAPVDVYFEEEQSVVQPDLLVVLHDNQSIIRDKGIYGAPDIIIEILSGNRLNDVVNKKELYAKTGVKEYFIIDPTNKQVNLFAGTGTGRFTSVFETQGKIVSALLRTTLEF
ncbi:Uma2 family endonuclease [Mucilaginibacter robiniae]|uniref:Uma2 family endonuclease n=1 Tax=Mucilaginibacter robiniae TaxID=2728022 RepID=A0A7L5DYQ2_9SPHI|nr:Uma2 family endonuclease [Mucilaginibacter robiniae]QJD95911.1 Uma2 family endonuclease [Mucilaginibacter robiniae]